MVRTPHLVQVLVGEWGFPHVRGVDVDDVQPFGSIVRNETRWKRLIETKLAFVEKADD